MKLITIILAGLTITLVASQLLCGFWLASRCATTEGSAFHGKLGVGMSVAAMAVSVMAILVANGR
ncbi:MAG: hypothetical protein ACXWNQ_01460 [Anaerolineales bacterium]